MIELSPSLLAADFYNLEKQFNELNDSKIKYIHLDIMDGSYVPNISYGSDIIKDLRVHSDLIFDCHLMVNNPENQIDEFAKAGADIITFHPETTIHPGRVISQIKKHKIKAGIVLNTHTDENILKYLIDDIDLVLIMSVVPGFGGQEFIPQILEKVRRVRKIIDDSNKDIILEIDGGIKLHNVKDVISAGCDLVVAGSAVFNEKGIKNNIEEFYRVMNND